MMAPVPNQWLLWNDNDDAKNNGMSNNINNNMIAQQQQQQEKQRQHQQNLCNYNEEVQPWCNAIAQQ